MGKESIALLGKKEEEITQYLTEEVQINETTRFSQHKLIKRIALFESHTYPTGKFDSQGNYKYWYDLITTRIESEVKNIDFDFSRFACLFFLFSMSFDFECY